MFRRLGEPFGTPLGPASFAGRLLGLARVYCCAGRQVGDQFTESLSLGIQKPFRRDPTEPRVFVSQTGSIGAPVTRVHPAMLGSLVGGFGQEGNCKGALAMQDRQESHPEVGVEVTARPIIY